MSTERSKAQIKLLLEQAEMAWEWKRDCELQSKKKTENDHTVRH